MRIVSEKKRIIVYDGKNRVKLGWITEHDGIYTVTTNNNTYGKNESLPYIELELERRHQRYLESRRLRYIPPG
jgi:hypothetical protein